MEGVSEVRVRPMEGEDVAPVMVLERALFPKDAWSEDMLRGELAEPTRHYFVADRGGDLVGYAGLRAVPPEGDVQTIAVRADAQGDGVGTRLLTTLLAEAQERGVTEMFLEVRSDNPRARELYRRFGFGEIGVRRKYYRDADAIVMRRSASAAERSGEERIR
ncbi:ribosomal protein S18-alanine N-acetyltransferase [Nocardiopsis baichengensis]|uniref:ribosomal protein S18-alanine N-acetyltransferase n=1 Tax=Nocardiopsis baichengensis TaxID=280240 RepID=UPI00034A1B16|nr:ribosomal protein S18-alanine N-acetyltransferase [Nocardiopsis baichengensis]